MLCGSSGIPLSLYFLSLLGSLRMYYGNFSIKELCPPLGQETSLPLKRSKVLLWVSITAEIDLSSLLEPLQQRLYLHMLSQFGTN